MEECWVDGRGSPRLRCLEWSGKRSGAEPPLVLLHGMSSNARFWGRLAPYLHGYRTVAVDLRGHGRSERPAEGYSTQEMAADIARVVKALDLERPVIVGHSWGAAVGLELVAGRWVPATAFVIVDGPTISLQEHVTFEVADTQMRPPERCYCQLEEAEMDQAAFLRDAWGDDLRDFVRDSFDQTPSGWCRVVPEPGRAAMVKALYRFQPETLLATLEIPVLIAMASDDSDGVAPAVLGWWRSQGENAARRCKDGTCRRYDSRHDIPLIRPEALARDIQAIALRAASA